MISNFQLESAFQFILNHWFFYLGLSIFTLRLLKFKKNKTDILIDELKKNGLDELAIIVPARNEAQNLPQFLESTKPLLELGTTLIVVNDQSTDDTYAIAKSAGVEVVTTPHRPDKWSGKNWACYQGYLFLKSLSQEKQIKYLLFTDADTLHSLSGMNRGLNYFKTKNSHLMTARPFHLNPTFWEKCTGPFYLMIYFITNAMGSNPSFKRFFSIGQFLLFDKSCYEKIGGHKAIANELADDLSLTQLCFDHNFQFHVYPHSDLYKTRMYSTPINFFKGWLRNFRLGMKSSSPWTVVETIITVGSLFTPQSLQNYFLVVIILLVLQKREGAFYWVGALFYPLPLFIFTIASLCASFSNLMNLPIQWKSRRYPHTSK